MDYRLLELRSCERDQHALQSRKSGGRESDDERSSTRTTRRHGEGRRDQRGSKRHGHGEDYRGCASAADLVKIKDIVEKNVDIKKDIVEKNIVEVPWTLRRASRLQAPPAPRPGTPRERITGKRRGARPPPGQHPGRIPPCPRRRRSTWAARASDFIILFIIFFTLGGQGA